MSEDINNVLEENKTKIEILANKLESINNLNEEDSYNLIKDEYKNFLSSIIDNPVFDKIKTNPKFIISLSQVCLETELTLDERVNCNSMIYKQLSITTKTPYLEKLYSFLGFVVNRTISNKLIQCGLTLSLASYLAVVRKSSFDIKNNINRMNFSILCLGPEIMTIQRITDIYATLSNTIEDIKILFLSTMTDIYVTYSSNQSITDDMRITNKNMNNALLSIVESLTPHDIESIFKEYNELIENNMYDENDVRFSLSNIDPKLFPKINYVVNYLYSKQIYLP